MSSPSDRRFEPRSPANTRALVLAGGMELNALITDQSNGGLRLRFERQPPLPKTFVVIDIAAGQALDVTLAWHKGIEAGVKRTGGASLRGLVPGRLVAARDAWRRVGGR